MPQADQVARQMQASALRSVGFLVHRLDFPPTGWTATFARCPAFPTEYRLRRQLGSASAAPPTSPSFIKQRRPEEASIPPRWSLFWRAPPRNCTSHILL